MRQCPGYQYDVGIQTWKMLNDMNSEAFEVFLLHI